MAAQSDVPGMICVPALLPAGSASELDPPPVPQAYSGSRVTVTARAVTGSERAPPVIDGSA